MNESIRKFWDWIDSRDIDKHVVAICVMYGVWVVTAWSTDFAARYSAKSGIEIAAIIAAVTTPYMTLAGAVIKWYFGARTTQ